MNNLNLILDKLNYGTLSHPWDLSIILYKGASLENRRHVMTSIAENKYGSIVESRLNFTQKIYAYFNDLINGGVSHDTIRSKLRRLFIFIKWCDKNDKDLKTETCFDLYIEWENFTVNEITRTGKKRKNPYSLCNMVASILASALEDNETSASYLMAKANSGIRYIKSEKKSLNEAEMLQFGRFLKDLINSLTIETVRGELPLRLMLFNGKELILKAHVQNPDLDIYNIQKLSDKQDAIDTRRALLDNESLLDTYKRFTLLHTRIDAEMLIFISQTGMNPSQALALKITEFRWMSQDNDYEVFTVFKGRRNGEATFRFYKGYRKIFENYLLWLKEVGFDEDSYLFPKVHRKGVILEKNEYNPLNIKKICKEASIPYFTPSQLRNFKANWLFENTNDLNLVTQSLSHTEDIFIRKYHKINTKKAIKELNHFSQENTKDIIAGLCKQEGITVLEDNPINSIQPDCINPEGCLFCTSHRDVLSYDYYWKLASHRYLKKLEMGLNPALSEHPANYVIQRIDEKLEQFVLLGHIHAEWVAKARDEVRSGEYHDYWKPIIECIEEII